MLEGPILVVVAHPDDEVLGCGATLARLAAQGVNARACFVSGAAEVRTHRPSDDGLAEDMRQAQHLLGLGEPIVGSFPNIRLNVEAHVDLVQFIEHAVIATEATVILTHHPADLNDDHRHVSLACQAAARIHQRRPGLPPLAGLLYMEILSSTDWAFPGGAAPFSPTAFVEVGGRFLETKVSALRAYRGVMRDYPHPRSDEAVRALAVLRGAQAGMRYAEAFQVAHVGHRL